MVIPRRALLQLRATGSPVILTRRGTFNRNPQGYARAIAQQLASVADRSRPAELALRNHVASESIFWHILDDISGTFAVPIVAAFDLAIPANLMATQASSRGPPLRLVRCNMRVRCYTAGVYGATYGSLSDGAFWKQSRYAYERQCVNRSQTGRPTGQHLSNISFVGK